MKTFLAGFFVVLLVHCEVRADIFDTLGLRGSKNTNQTANAQVGLNGLSQDQMVQGLKDALEQGVQHAVSQLGREGGYLANPTVKIPMPDKLRTVEKALRKLKQDTLADDFI